MDVDYITIYMKISSSEKTTIIDKIVDNNFLKILYYDVFERNNDKLFIYFQVIDLKNFKILKTIKHHGVYGCFIKTPYINNYGILNNSIKIYNLENYSFVDEINLNKYINYFNSFSDGFYKKSQN